MTDEMTERTLSLVPDEPTPKFAPYPDSLTEVFDSLPAGSTIERLPNCWVVVLKGKGEVETAPMALLGSPEQSLYDLLKAGWPRIAPEITPDVGANG